MALVSLCFKSRVIFFPDIFSGFLRCSSGEVNSSCELCFPPRAGFLPFKSLSTAKEGQHRAGLV